MSPVHVSVVSLLRVCLCLVLLGTVVGHIPLWEATEKEKSLFMLLRLCMCYRFDPISTTLTHQQQQFQNI